MTAVLSGTAPVFLTAGCVSSGVVGPWRSACGPATPPTTAAAGPGTPETAVLAWFSAINHKDGAAAVAAFEPSAAAQMNWGNGDTSTCPTFSTLKCKPQSQMAPTAAVYWTFDESAAPAVGNADSFWTV